MTNRNTLRIIALIMLVSVLLGCAPYINSYYLPESQDGHRSGHSTLTSDAPIWILERGDATFYFSASRDQGGLTIFNLNIQPVHLPGETSLSAKARDEARAAVQPITIGLENTRNGITIFFDETTEIIKPVRVARGAYGTNNRHNIESFHGDLNVAVDQYIELSTVLKSTESRSYVVKWPAIVINRQQVILPPIKFLWKHGVQVKFING